MLVYLIVLYIGFLLFGIVGGGEEGYVVVLFYVLSYVIMLIVGFGVIIVLFCSGFEVENINDFKGLNVCNLWMVGLVLCIMVLMVGIFLFLGFWIKLVVLGVVINGGMLWLVILGVLCVVVGCFYYLCVIKVMYFDELVGELLLVNNDCVLGVVLGVNVLVLLVFGLVWNLIMVWC